MVAVAAVPDEVSDAGLADPKLAADDEPVIGAAVVDALELLPVVADWLLTVAAELPPEVRVDAARAASIPLDPAIATTLATSVTRRARAAG